MEIDDAQLNEAERIISDAIGETNHGLHREPWLYYDECIKTTMMVVEAEAKKRAKKDGGWVHHPDFYVRFDGDTGHFISPILLSPCVKMEACYRLEPLIIEIDGSIHNKKLKKTFERNTDYAQAGLSYISVNIEDCEVSKRPWQAMLREGVERYIGGAFQ